MALIRLENISKYYGANLVLENITWQLNIGEKVGLVGTNGTGKTTLLKIINNEIDFDSGTVKRMKNLRVGYLTQEVHLESENTIYDEMVSTFEKINILKRRMDKLEKKMADQENDINLLTEKYGQLQHEYEHLGGYDVKTEIDKVLHGLGFTKADWDKPVDILSGGQQSRVALAKILLKKPDIILLDEPTNHLDIYAVEWLEQFLTEYEGALLVVSHDRYFLDKIVKNIIELEFHQLSEYSGNYSKYVKLKAQRLANRKKKYELQQAEIKHHQEFIRRNIAGQKTKLAQSRRKKLHKMEKIKPPKKPQKINLNFDPNKRGGNDVIRAMNLSKRYGDLELFNNLRLFLERGNRVGIVGPNGSGKTTLLKVLIGLEEPTSGTVKIGHGIEIGYYDQQLNTLNQENSVLDEVWQIRPWDSIEKMRSYLAKFLFQGDEVFLRIDKLSGGEQSRVALAKLILSGVNFLVLDEPTNHLDIYSRMALEDALQDYDGTILTVSHDRYFLDKIVNKIIYIEDGETKIYLGNYSYVQQKRKEEQLKELEQKRKISSQQKKQRKHKKIKQKKKKKLRPIKLIEEDIAITENEIDEITEEMNNPDIYTDYKLVQSMNNELDQLKDKVEELYQEWEEVLEVKK